MTSMLSLVINLNSSTVQEIVNWVTTADRLSLVVSLIMPRLHYGNATLAGLPEYQHYSQC